MANQPKKYKKFVATAATATLVASAIVPVASAAGFKDVPANHEHVEAINALTEAGIINGYTDGTFKPGQAITRGQVVKLLGRWLETQGQEIPADWNKEQRFSDLPVDGKDAELVKYAALTKDAGVFNGSAGKLTASQNISRQQMAVVLVRAIEEITGEDLVAAYKEAGFETEISDLDKAFSSEQTDAIKALEFAEITIVPTGKFRPTESLNRGQFASFLYRTINLEPGDVALSGSVKAINNTTVEVTFDEEVEDIKALDFAIEGLEVNNAAVKQGKGNENVVVLTTSAQTADVVYKVTVNEEEIGSFKGIGSIIPTKITVETTSIQAKVGTQVSIKANIGQEAAGVAVTFNVQATGNSLNANKVVEVTTDAKGVATYTYTQYGVAGVDNVTAYPTGAPSLLGYAKVYWGKEQILTIDADAKTIDNGANRTYKVKYLDPTTGLPVQNQKLNVTFKENLNDIDGSKTNDTNASIRKDLGNYVTPYQDNATVTGTNREEAFQIVTNSVGEATFVVTGKNTTATPVVFEDKNTNSRFENTELQVEAGNVKFQGVQSPYTITWDKTTDFVAAMSSEYGQQNPIEYKLKVVTDQKDKDGNPLPYVGASIKVAIQQNQDATLTNNTPALISADEEKGYTNNGTVTVVTDSKGEATVYLKSTVDNSKATPVAWIDLNAAGQVGYVGNDKLEEGEPNQAASTVTFLKSVVVAPGYKLNTPTTGAFVTGDRMTWKASLENQSGKVSETAGIKNATYTITNNSNKIVTINPRLVDAAGTNYNGLTITYAGSTQTQNFTNGQAVTLEPNTTVTLHGIANGYFATTTTVNEYSTTNDALLHITAPDVDGKISVASSVNTVRKTVTQDIRNNNNTYTYEAKLAEFIKSVYVAKGGTTVTGEVIGHEIVDKTVAASSAYAEANKFNIDSVNNYGRVVIKERHTGVIKHYYYNATEDTFSVTNDGNFQIHESDNVLADGATGFEKLLSVGDEIQVNNKDANYQQGTVRLFNEDFSTNGKTSGNGVLAALAIVSATTQEVGTANGSVDQVVVEFNNAVTQAQINALGRLVGSEVLLTGVSVNADYKLADPQLVAGSTNKVAFKVLASNATANATIDTALLAGNVLSFNTTDAAAFGLKGATSTVIKDGAAPVIVGHTTADKDGANGLDTVNFLFSEAIDTSSVDAKDFRFAVPGMAAPGYTSGIVGSEAWNGTTKTLTVEFDNTTPPATLDTLTFEYAASNSATFNKAVKDIAGNELKPVKPTAVNGGNNPGNGNQVAADKVIANITALPAVDKLTIADKATVVAARAAFDALTADQKKLVTNEATLTAAEAKIKELEGTQVSKTVKELNATVQQLVLGVFAVRIDLAQAEAVNAVEGSTLTVKVTGKADITLTYKANVKAFINGNIQGYTQAEIEAGTVSVK